MKLWMRDSLVKIAACTESCEYLIEILGFARALLVGTATKTSLKVKITKVPVHIQYFVCRHATNEIPHVIPHVIPPYVIPPRFSLYHLLFHRYSTVIPRYTTLCYTTVIPPLFHVIPLFAL